MDRIIACCTGAPTLHAFGEGGVDDAEDGDVIIHELGHAISHMRANSNSGTERSTYDEALGDYFAERYGRLLGITSNRVFDWDGNNTFWSGRSVSYDGVKTTTTWYLETSTNIPTSWWLPCRILRRSHC